MTYVEETTAADRKSLRNALALHISELEDANEVFQSLLYEQMATNECTREYELSLLRMIQHTLDDFLNNWNLTAATNDEYALKNEATYVARASLASVVEDKIEKYRKKLYKKELSYEAIMKETSMLEQMDDAKLNAELDKRLKEDLV